MKKMLIPLAFLLALGSTAARAQVSLHIDIGLPVAPPLVMVQPGIQVVEGFGEEVFFSGGWYWCRRPNGWYRARSPRARFDFVESRRVPPGLVRLPPGHYRNWHHDEHHGEHHGEGHHDNGRHEGEHHHDDRGHDDHHHEEEHRH